MKMRSFITIISLFCVFFLGIYIGGLTSIEPQVKKEIKKDKEIWTCSMHPEIKQDKKGLCPICAMDLIPLKNSSVNNNKTIISMTENALKLAEIRTQKVERKKVFNEITLSGKIDFDETRLVHITSKAPGRIERLFVDYTGMKIKKGDHLVSLYSPEMIVAQKELLTSFDYSRIREKPGFRENDTRDIVKISKKKLSLLGFTDDQIEMVIKKGKPVYELTVYSPVDGVVIKRQGTKGMYVDTGTMIYTIADLTQLWLKLDAYEMDIPWIKYGQKLEFETSAWPGEKFTGTVIFIDPVLNPETRTVMVRVNVDNSDGKLKPGMFVKAELKTRVNKNGEVSAIDLSGKWICPMHPEIVKDDPGHCSICEMPLVDGREIIVENRNENEENPLVIPVSAPLITGKRAVVYVVDKQHSMHYEAREILLGKRTGKYFIVKKGLAEGEEIVINGSFKLDSGLQIMAGYSMMSGRKKNKETNDKKTLKFENVNQELLTKLEKILKEYLKIKEKLISDEIEGIRKINFELKILIDSEFKENLSEKENKVWNKFCQMMDEGIKKIHAAEEIKSYRAGFSILSEGIIFSVERFGGLKDLYQMNCPMAFDGKGGNWLSDESEIRNPYYGEMMLRCGSVTRSYKGENNE